MSEEVVRAGLVLQRRRFGILYGGELTWKVDNKGKQQK